MDSQWASYVENPPATRQTRYYAAPPSLTSPQQHQQRDPTAQPQPRQESALKQDYHAKQDSYTTPSIASRAASMQISSPPVAQPTRSQSYHNGDNDGDVPMEDVDPYKPRYAAKSAQPGRSSAAYIQEQEASAAARRYSPMNLSPSSPYGSGSQQSAANYGSFSPTSTRQSPTRSNPYMSPPQSYYSPPGESSLAPMPVLMITHYDAQIASRAHPPQLPPIQSNMTAEHYYPQSATAQLNAAYGRDARSPRIPATQTPMTPQGPRGPVPSFTKCLNTADLQPHINEQPPFRRANPEGGFISVSAESWE